VPRYITAMSDDQKYHYHVIRRAIAEIDAAEAPLSLEALAARMSMSPAHFQRVFTQWVGVSPKRYQQYLTLDHARTLCASVSPRWRRQGPWGFRDQAGCMTCS
jgi:AraC family transcriptional regulator of adaptative response/methylated-DNA-[protein]-cysteine methyltransferase